MANYQEILATARTNYEQALADLYDKSVELQAAHFVARGNGSFARSADFSGVPAYSGYQGTDKLLIDGDGSVVHASNQSFKTDLNAEIERLKALP